MTSHCELLSSLLRAPHSWPLCVAGTTRPTLWERHPSWGVTSGPGGRHRRVDIDPLRAETSHELIRALLGGTQGLPAWLLDLLVERGEGNPYFTEELAHWLMEQGIVAAGPDGWTATEAMPAALAIPTTIQAVLQSRLERIDASERTTLEGAGVVGRVFWSGAVAHLNGHPIPPKCWEHLQHRDLIVAHTASQVPAEREFRFKHVLLRDVVYECTLKRVRRALHAKAAEWLLTTLGGRAIEWAPVIADHFEHAGACREAAEWFGRAGELAGTTAPVTAATHYRKAITLLGDTPEPATVGLRCAWYQGIGEALFATAKYAEAGEAYETVRSLAAQQGDVITQARALNLLAETQTPRGDYEGVIASADAALALLEKVGPEGQLQRVRALSVRGWGCRWLGRFDEARELALASLDLATQLGIDEEIAYASNLLGAVELSMGHCRAAVSRFEDSLAACTRRGDRRRVLSAFSNLGETARIMGDFPRAVACFQRALREAGELGYHHGERLYRQQPGRRPSESGGVRAGGGGSSGGAPHCRSQTGTRWGKPTLSWQKPFSAWVAVRKHMPRSSRPCAMPTNRAVRKSRGSPGARRESLPRLCLGPLRSTALTGMRGLVSRGVWRPSRRLASSRNEDGRFEPGGHVNPLMGIVCWDSSCWPRPRRDSESSTWPGHRRRAHGIEGAGFGGDGTSPNVEHLTSNAQRRTELSRTRPGHPSPTAVASLNPEP